MQPIIKTELVEPSDKHVVHQLKMEQQRIDKDYRRRLHRRRLIKPTIIVRAATYL